MDHLEARGIAENTLVIFTSDNGPEMTNRHPQAQRSYGSAGNLRGKKLQLWEGGIRVPLLIRWPGRADQGSVSKVPVSGVDLLPTLCELAGVTIPGVGLIVLIFAPYIDKNPSNKPDDRKFAISLMTVHLMFWAVLVVIGSFFRGPGFNFVLPWVDGLFFEL